MNDKTTKEMAVALLYCISKVGDYCNLCPYAEYGSSCSERLLRDASRKLMSLEETKDYLLTRD